MRNSTSDAGARVLEKVKSLVFAGVAEVTWEGGL